MANLENAKKVLCVPKDLHGRFHAAPVLFKKMKDKLVAISVQPGSFVSKAQVLLILVITHLSNVENVLLVTTAPQEQSRHTTIHAEREHTQTAV